MRIVDKQKDYYDGVMSSGMDMSLPYIRHRTNEEVSSWPFPSVFNYLNSCTVNVRSHVIGFCGSIYPVIQFYPPSVYKQGQMSRDHQVYMCHKVADIDTFMNGPARLNAEQLKYYTVGKKKPFSAGWSRDDFTHFFESWNKIKSSPVYVKWFDKGNAPIFTCTYEQPYTITYNALLGPYNFGKVKDPYTAFQDIRMWLSNRAAPEKPIPTMSDADNAARLGHGDKYSFRKLPSKHK